MELPNKQILVAVGLVEYGDRFLMLRRVSPVAAWHHKWNVPGGKVAPGETPADAVRREILEEAGITVTEPALLGIYTHHWRLPEHTQQTFLVVYRASAAHDTVVVKADENDAHKWVTLDECYALENILDGTTEMLRALYDTRVQE